MLLNQISNIRLVFGLDRAWEGKSDVIIFHGHIQECGGFIDSVRCRDKL